MPPNKYVFKGAEFLINADDVENPYSSFAPITNPYDSSMYSSSDDNSDSDDNHSIHAIAEEDEDEEVEEERTAELAEDERQISQETVIVEKPSADLSPNANPSKRRRLSEANNSEL